jgi:glycosyltransferase involved in cell wall biosynthesis
MHIGIDASNLLSGGGLTHLAELLNAADPDAHGFDEVVVWGGDRALSRLHSASWLRLVEVPVLNRSLPHRIRWQMTQLDRVAEAARCDVLFVPGGSFTAHFRPIVTMSRNLIPFDRAANALFGVSPMRLKLSLLAQSQSRSFRAATGMIFLTDTARRVVEARPGPLSGLVATIPHGVSPSFRRPPVDQLPLSAFSETRPFRLLYVSPVFPYKHQWTVIEAVARLRAKRIPVSLHLVGGTHWSAARRLSQALRRFDPGGSFVQCSGDVPYSSLPARYHGADGFVFASSCENMPNSLLEAMASSLPIACGNRSVMPEVLGDGGLYFDPEDAGALTEVLETFLHDSGLRSRLAEQAHARAREFSWDRCARDTFAFLRQVTRLDAPSLLTR